ncbi:MAG: hypothetical protein ACR2IE_00170 [Candidatus Sumerlaeaceae bacterium]
MESLILDKNRFIRDEFECFVRIGMDINLRSRVRRVLEHRLITGNPFAALPTIYFETRSCDGVLKEMWYLEADCHQLRRLLEFLRRFNIEDVKLIDAMLHR